LALRAADEKKLSQPFATLGDSLLDAQQEYLAAKSLDEALFGEKFER
jgi:hypothetical protein